MKNNIKIYVSIFGLSVILLAICLGFRIHYFYHFYPQTTVNGINISGKTVKEAEKMLADELGQYQIDLILRGGVIESIAAGDVGLKVNIDLARMKSEQNHRPIHILEAFSGYYTKSESAELILDEKLLTDCINQLKCTDEAYEIAPDNPRLEYNNRYYIIIPETSGNIVNKEVLLSELKEALLLQKKNLDLESHFCYIRSQYNTHSAEVKEAFQKLNLYSNTTIDYIFGNHHEIIDCFLIQDWLTVDADYQVTLNEELVLAHIEMLSEKYNRRDHSRPFLTSTGNWVEVESDDFDFELNVEVEAEKIRSAIILGLKLVVETDYWDLGNTYVEIDLSGQHIWFYLEGELIIDGDIVTGCVSSGCATPDGIYAIRYKAKNVVLRGPDYASPVTFWMPFNGGIGIHDANWRNTFGGNIYKTNGSHGCINCPYEVAHMIYDSIEVGTPVICYD